MNYKKHTAFMIEFISDFVNGDLERYFFDLDYSAYVIEHFPYMERENAKFADKFANTIDQAYERGTDLNLSDEEFRVEISNALDEWLGTKRPDIL
jgi:pyrroloquinoline quinone (PQQ) biosynthesis protein C